MSERLRLFGFQLSIVMHRSPSLSLLVRVSKFGNIGDDDGVTDDGRNDGDADEDDANAYAVDRYNGVCGGYNAGNGDEILADDDVSDESEDEIGENYDDARTDAEYCDCDRAGPTAGTMPKTKLMMKKSFCPVETDPHVKRNSRLSESDR